MFGQSGYDPMNPPQASAGSTAGQPRTIQGAATGGFGRAARNSS